MKDSNREYVTLLQKAHRRENSGALTWEEAEATPALSFDPAGISWAEHKPAKHRRGGAGPIKAEAPAAPPLLVPPVLRCPVPEPEHRLPWNARPPEIGTFHRYAASDVNAGEHLGYSVTAPDDATLWETFL